MKSLGLAQQEIARLNATTSKILKLELKKVRYLRSLSFVQGTFVNLLRTSILFLMLYLIFTQRITVGQFFSLFIYSFFIFGPLQELGNVVNTYRETEVSLQNFEAILAMPPEPRPEHPVPIGSPRQLRFDDVSFQHQSAIDPALQDISFRRIARRDHRLRRALRRRQDHARQTAGRPLPAAIRATSTTTARQKTRSRSTPCASGSASSPRTRSSSPASIRENLLFVRPDATDEECMDVLRQASVESLLPRADRGLDTVIGEGGVKVSGGEKQRLSIARALLRQPQLLVFDEATSSLDSLTEEEISQTIRDVAATRDAITILIAHRLSTVLHADRIYVLERGRIVEFGRHEELLDRKGLYYAMWRQQVGEGSRVDRRTGRVISSPPTSVVATIVVYEVCTVWASLALTVSLSVATVSAADIGVVEEIIAKVNGDIITRSEIERTRRADGGRTQEARWPNGPELQKALAEREKDALRERIDQLLLVQKGKEMSINVEPDVSKYIAELQLQSKIADPEKFQQYVREQTGQTFEDFKSEVRNGYLTQRVIRQEVGGRLTSTARRAREVLQREQG